MRAVVGSVNRLGPTQIPHCCIGVAAAGSTHHESCSETAAHGRAVTTPPSSHARASSNAVLDPPMARHLLATSATATPGARDGAGGRPARRAQHASLRRDRVASDEGKQVSALRGAPTGITPQAATVASWLRSVEALLRPRRPRSTPTLLGGARRALVLGGLVGEMAPPPEVSLECYRADDRHGDDVRNHLER